jgi:BirA family transcriptional regulator, biotin operon repressor / biotin---[acetyl-CoA-carboxylase] ligase
MTHFTSDVIDHTIKLLSDGAPHPSWEIAKKLKVTTNHVAGIIEALKAFDLTVNALNNHEYQLASPLILLAPDKIQENLDEHIGWPMGDIFVCTETSSTQDLARNAPDTSRLHCFLTEYQTIGRGRFGRKWFSPFASNLYLSCCWSVKKNLHSLQGLSLVISLAIIEAIKKFTGLTLSIKWPNDILWKNKKLGGILIEIDSASYNHIRVIIGVGLNVNMPANATAVIDRPFASLNQLMHQDLNRNVLAGYVIQSMREYLSLFSEKGFACFLPLWAQYDALFGKEITLQIGTEKKTGRMRGINAQGLLLLEQNNGNISAYLAGETSLHLSNTTD